MCNPPFYTSPSELLASAAAKYRPPHSACPGAIVEMVVPGGEVAFVRRMINESLSLKSRCQWFTSMLGKLASVPLIVETLKSVGIENWCVKELIQGEKTRRWAIAWSWLPLKPAQVSKPQRCSNTSSKMNPQLNFKPKSVARGIPGLPKHLLPFPVEHNFTVPASSLEATSNHLNNTLSAFDLKWQYRPSQAVGVGFASHNGWSRAARRHRKHQNPNAGTYTGATHNNDKYDANEEEGDTGTDTVLFESFCGMLRSHMMSS